MMDRRRIELHLKEARLLHRNTLTSFDFNAAPVISKAKVMSLAIGDVWSNNGHNLLMFGSARNRSKPSDLGARNGFGGKRPSGTVHSNHRSGATTATGASRTD